MQIGKSIRAMREEQSLSRSAFASGIDVSVADLEDYEAGRIRLPAKAMMEAAILLDVDASVFFAGLPLGRQGNRACPPAEARASARTKGRVRRG